MKLQKAYHPHSSAVTILKSRLKIAIFCQNRPQSKSLHLLVICRFFAAINGCYWIKRLQFSSVPDWVLHLY